ncbi:hypothetical protein BJY52DRAFT_1323059 [Lactarius psammicola]|nr:hypothetical protein BJY52DRAFT_1323059 [Lactarius psammicola]
MMIIFEHVAYLLTHYTLALTGLGLADADADTPTRITDKRWEGTLFHAEPDVYWLEAPNNHILQCKMMKITMSLVHARRELPQTKYKPRDRGHVNGSGCALHPRV